MNKGKSPWWTGHVHADRRKALLARNTVKARIRSWFEAKDFVEVECGSLAISPGNEAHLHAFATEAIAPGGARARAFLHTSPEFAAKKLLVAGETKIFEFARVFRNREQGPLHAPEFTMLEWYRAHAPYSEVMTDCVNIVREAANATGVHHFAYRGVSCDPRAEFASMTVGDAFSTFAGIDLASTLTDEGEGDRNRLAACANGTGIVVADDDSWSDLFSKVLVARIENNLGLGRPLLLYQYPRCEAALARACEHDLRFAERFELYACGIELANGFGELTDAHEQRRRFELEMAVKQRVYGERYPIDEDFLSALSQMPEASGVALGFDRLAMLAAGARTVEDVIWTPFPLWD